MCHEAAQTPNFGGGPAESEHQKGGSARESNESYKYRSNLPQRGGLGHGCGPADSRLQRSSLPSVRESQYGNGLSNPLDIAGRKLDGGTQLQGLQDHGHGLNG
mmetsp:Transcript_35579/g.72786  ORF Transcript_35579/g.72786 Transcript_35579/m.72786 type:complete len:103 (+) Transcript_35579:445-753(+)